jgi:integrase
MLYLPILFHLARHTMATLAANKAGIDIARVDEMLNHSDSTLKLARVYIERDYSVLWEANRKLLSLFKWDGLK